MGSDLRILVVGFVKKDYSHTFSTLNALVGRQAFSRDRWSEKQEASVAVEGGRRLWLTYMPDNLFRDIGNAYSEGRTTELENTIYHCVVIAMAFNESTLGVRYNREVSETLCQKFGESFLKNYCVIIVGGGDGFAKARSEGRQTKTFEGWCKAFAARDGDNCFAVFKGVQERWLLFNNNGSSDELKQQRQQLVDIVDTQILVGSHHTDMKFNEVEIKAAKLEKLNLGLGLLVVVMLLFLLIPLLWSAPTNRPREITMRDEGLDLRRYVNSKFEETTKRLRKMERRIAGLKTDGHDKTGASNEKDSERADKRIQLTEEEFAEIKQQVMIDSTVQVEEIQRIVEKYCEKGSHLWEMIKSLPISLPLLIGLTVTILSVSTVPLPVPFPALLAALFVSLLILQLLLLVILLGA